MVNNKKIMINRAKTKIVCNGCPNLKIIKRKIMDGKRIDRRTWVLYCKGFKGDVFIDVIDVMNNDLKNKEMPLIVAPFICPLREIERIKDKEMNFEMQIS